MLMMDTHKKNYNCGRRGREKRNKKKKRGEIRGGREEEVNVGGRIERKLTTSVYSIISSLTNSIFGR